MSKKVKTRWLVVIPEGATIKVKSGKEVEAGEELWEIDTAEEGILNVGVKIGKLKRPDKEKLREMLPGMIVNDNQVIFKTRGIFSQKIILPINGEVVKLDEFDNLHYKRPEVKTRKASSPVKAKVAKIEANSLELEFRAMEFVGVGINDGKAWAPGGIGYGKQMADLSSTDRGKIILTETADQAWLLKAEVVGVSGAVIIDNEDREKNDRINLQLPVLALEKREWEELKSQANGEKRAFINATGGRLLLVI